ncbi:MAG TPA: C-terminal helicase domain-containing protein, partial [Oleiagrimonas sp.]|nr:C-terminal helicase domain-containing protein [Oleiagrimonas sp.]
LVKAEEARGIRESAKFELLMEMLPALLAEGRRVLVFSQFTEMLGLIAHELDRRHLDYVTLTGDTRDRAEPVRRFQDGEVPLFLLSLKAGGVGLNLTAADAVIHYDPWWNPAAEAQASDRAHRIGQDKPVFVYRLITAGTVEERIEAMKARKAELAEAVLSGGGSRERLKFDQDDLDALLAPA